MSKKFYVKSKSFPLYEAFRKECEKLGWIYNTKFTDFTEKESGICNCLFFSTGWYRSDDNKFAFSNSHSDLPNFNLETEWMEAIKHAKNLITPPIPFKDFAPMVSELRIGTNACIVELMKRFQITELESDDTLGIVVDEEVLTVSIISMEDDDSIIITLTDGSIEDFMDCETDDMVAIYEHVYSLLYNPQD